MLLWQSGALVGRGVGGVGRVRCALVCECVSEGGGALMNYSSGKEKWVPFIDFLS